MKLNKIFVTLTLALTAATGLGASLFAKKETKQADAASWMTIYLDKSDCGKFKQDNTTTYVYYYNCDTYSTTWPGIAMTENNGLFSASIPTFCGNIIFNIQPSDGTSPWGGDCQTEDLTFDGSKPLWTIYTNNTDGSKQKAYDTVYQKNIYVLDKSNSPLSVTQKMHAWRNDGSSAGATTWPGLDMSRVGGANSHIYSATVLGDIDRVIFNNNSGNQTANLTIDGECSVLESDWNGTKWVRLESAQFVDNCMHFYDVPVTDTSSTQYCSDRYQTAKTAYNALSSNEVRKEVLSINDVSDRLSAWAEANGDTLASDGTALSSRAFTPYFEKNNYAIIIVVAMSIIGSLLGAFLLLKKRKHQ